MKPDTSPFLRALRRNRAIPGPSAPPHPKPNTFTLLRALRLPLLRQATTAALFASLLLQSTAAVAPTPTWWGTQSVLNTNAVADDFAAANVGQLKYFAAMAAAEMNTQLSGGAGADIVALMSAWNTDPATGVTRDDYAALTAGQLKAVAALFYDRLAAAGSGTQGVYPWGGSGTVADDYAVVNVGQLKAVFAFEVPKLVATTGTGSGVTTGGGIGTIGTTGTTGSQSSKDQKDDDGDGIPNDVETNLGLDPEVSNADSDLDGDSYTDVEEYLAGSDIFDQKSRPGPAILALRKYYGFEYDESQITPNAPKFKTFSGNAKNVDFDDSFIEFTDKGDGNATDKGDTVRSKFEQGSFDEDKGIPDYPRICFGYEDLETTYSTYPTKGAFKREAWGWATRFSITGATIDNPPAVPWTRIYLVKKYTGDPKDYANEGDMIFGDEVGFVVFSQDEKGNQSVTFQPSDSSASDSAIINDGKSVVFIPPQVRDVVTSYRLTPVPVKVVEVSPKTKDENSTEIVGSENPSASKPLTPFVEIDPNTNKIAHRELKVRIGSSMVGKKVSWTLDALPGATPAVIRGKWADSPTHKDRFEASTSYGDNGFTKDSEEQAKTAVGTDGYTAIRVNVPPIGFNQVRIKIQIEGMNAPVRLIDMEVPGVVVIDPGHGGTANMPGSSWNNAESPSHVLEKTMALDYGLALEEALKTKAQKDKLNVRVFMTRRTDINLAGSKRANKARDNGADVIFVLHFNSDDDTSRGRTPHRSRGTLEVYRTTNNVFEKEDTDLSSNVIDRMVAAMEPFDAGVNHRSRVGFADKPAVSSDLNNGNTEKYHPIRTAYIEGEFIDFGEDTKDKTDDLVDILLNTGPNVAAVKLALVNAIRDAILQDMRDQPKQ